MTIEKRLKTIKPFAGFLMIMCFVFSSCYEEKEACLDVQSANYDLSADIPCDDCCNYPSLVLWVSHQADEVLLSYDSIYQNDYGQKFQFVDFKLILNNFSFKDDLLRSFSSLDSIEVIANDPSNTFFLHEDIVVVDRANIQYGLGSFNAFGNLEEISFDIGVDSAIRDIDLNTLPESHPLNDSLLIDDNGALMNGYFVLKQIDSGDEIVIQLQKNNSNQSIAFDIQSDVNPGFSIEINLIIDYLYLLYSADLENDSNDIICDKLLLNIPSSFILQ